MYGRRAWLLWAKGVTLLLLLAHIPPTQQLPDQITIAGLFDKSDIKQQVAFRYAVRIINGSRVLGSRTNLIDIVAKIPPHDSFSASKSVCNFMNRGVAAIFGPQSPKTSSVVQSICDALEIPHIETRWEYKLRRDDYSINLYPHPSSLSQAYLDLVRLFKWKSFCILYEDNKGLVRLQDLFKKARKNEFKICVKQLPLGHNYRHILSEIQAIGEYNIILDCATENIFVVLKQAQQIGMMSSMHNYIITSLDLHLVKLEDFRYSGTNITSLQIVDRDKEEIRNLMEDWQAGRVLYTNRLAEDDVIMKTETALMYDAVQLFAQSIKALDESTDVQMMPSNCRNETPWSLGNSLVNYMKVENLHGLTGEIKFDSSGFRTDFKLDIIELQRHSLAKVGVWSRTHGANYTRRASLAQDNGMGGIRNKTLRVSVALNDPYIMLAESTKKLTGNDRYEGFCIDLLSEVAAKLNFNYIVKRVKNDVYGNYDSNKKEWTGMIREIMEGRADLAMTDLTISYERQQAVDFTMPFMNLGISIMYVKPKKAPPSLFSFLSPLSIEVWIYMISAYVGVSLLMYILSRFSPYEWQNPHPCNSDPDTLENQFTLLNCLWFSIGSLMQQGCDFLPQAVSTRMVAGMWWFFTLIMISSYTANLAAFLTIEQLETQIESVEDLAKQTKIKYGTKNKGTTKDFFRDNTMELFERMWRFMENERPSVFVASNEEGVARVKNASGLYAYFMESTSIEYATERECSLTQVGGLLDSKSYGIALAKNSSYKGELDVGLLTLQSEGRFHILKNKWFRQQRGGGRCKEEAGGGGGASELNLSNVGGVFVVLLSGMGLALIVAIFEFATECYNIAKEDEIPLAEVLKTELTFVFKCKGSSKPVRKKAESETDNTDMYGCEDYNYTAKNPLT